MEEITGILVDLFIIFTAGKGGGEFFVRLKQAEIVGEVLAGIIIGPYALGLIGSPDSELVQLFHGDREAAEEALNITLNVIAGLGVIILLFFVGLKTHVRDLLGVRNRAVAVAVLGVVIPLVLGFGLVWATGPRVVDSP